MNIKLGIRPPNKGTKPNIKCIMKLNRQNVCQNWFSIQKDSAQRAGIGMITKETNSSIIQIQATNYYEQYLLFSARKIGGE